eukprot:COSAG05_NODE_1342_length_5140_cov_2.897838_4_plen_80_part_00
MDKTQHTGFVDPMWVLIKSYWRTFRYHLGSLAVGSFIVALVKMIKYPRLPHNSRVLDNSVSMPCAEVSHTVLHSVCLDM